MAAPLVVLVAAAAAYLSSERDGTDRVVGTFVGRQSAALLAAVPPQPTAAVTVSTGDGLPVPEPLPANPHEATPHIVIGTIEIPSIGVVEPLQEGMTLTAINRGPSHWPGTALPGRLGNVVVAGHRTTYSQPFNRLDELRPGDPVVFSMSDGSTHTYAVRTTLVVPEASIGIAAQHPAHTATLFACHPKGSATHRIVATLVLLGEDGLPVDDEASLPPLDVGLRPGDETLVVRSTDSPAPIQDPLADT